MTTKEILKKLEDAIDALDAVNPQNDVFLFLMAKAKYEACNRANPSAHEYPATVLFELQQLLRATNCDRVNQWFADHGFSLLGTASDKSGIINTLRKAEEAFSANCASTKIAIIGGMLCTGMVGETLEIWKGIFSLLPNI